MNAAPDQPHAHITADEAVRRFTQAEQALQQLITSADQLTSATRTVEQARADLTAAEHRSSERVASARGALERTEHTVAVASAAVLNAAEQLSGVAHSLHDTAAAFRGLEPDRLWSALDETRRNQRIMIVLVALTLLAAVIAVVV